jgi:hypothetical protein
VKNADIVKLAYRYLKANVFLASQRTLRWAFPRRRVLYPRTNAVILFDFVEHHLHIKIVIKNDMS